MTREEIEKRMDELAQKYVETHDMKKSNRPGDWCRLSL